VRLSAGATIVNVHLVCGSLALAPRLIEVIEETHHVFVTGHTTVPREAIAAIARSKPDVVVIEAKNPVSPGLRVIGALRDLSPRPVFIVLADDMSEGALAHYARAGADYSFDRFRHLYDLGRTLEMLSPGLPSVGATTARRAAHRLQRMR
jgi:DNA-binding NarL/FixJ family response regulator